MIKLAIDASTYVGDVALLDGTNVLAEESAAMKGAEQERLMPAVASVLERSGRRMSDVGQIVCGAGPGSFTSLRIAGGIAKGLATGARIPLFAVPSMALIVGGAPLHVGRYVVAVDALRGDFYAGLYHVGANGEILELERARLVKADEVEMLAAEHSAVLVSPSELPGAVRATPKARAVGRMEQVLASSGPVDIDSWEPAYGRLAEAQVKWEAAHGRPLPAG